MAGTSGQTSGLRLDVRVADDRDGSAGADFFNGQWTTVWATERVLGRHGARRRCPPARTTRVVRAKFLRRRSLPRAAGPGRPPYGGVGRRKGTKASRRHALPSGYTIWQARFSTLESLPAFPPVHPGRPRATTKMQLPVPLTPERVVIWHPPRRSAEWRPPVTSTFECWPPAISPHEPCRSSQSRSIGAEPPTKAVARPRPGNFVGRWDNVVGMKTN